MVTLEYNDRHHDLQTDKMEVNVPLLIQREGKLP